MQEIRSAPVSTCRLNCCGKSERHENADDLRASGKSAYVGCHADLADSDQSQLVQYTCFRCIHIGLSYRQGCFAVEHSSVPIIGC